MQYSYDLFVKELGEKLKQMRKERGWTLRDMVTEHRLHLTQWQRLERGKGVATPSLLRICEVFDVGLAELVGDFGQVGRAVEPVTSLVKTPAQADSSAEKVTKKAGSRRVSPKTSSPA